MFIGLNLFHCKKGGYITSNNICDEIIHSPYDNSDEYFCKTLKYVMNIKILIVIEANQHTENIAD